ncbi:MAG: SAM-dependent methyltransferase, partial [Parasporobacterium sp.]|nr:SAM-dependent methyltransferase [Parasporobacterium sp.]
ILSGMRDTRLSPRRLCMVYPKVSKEASLVLVEGIRGGNTEIRAEAPVILQQEDGSETLQIRQIHVRA